MKIRGYLGLEIDIFEKTTLKLSIIHKSIECMLATFQLYTQDTVRITKRKKDMTEILTGLIIGAGGSVLNFISTRIYNKVTGSSKNFIWFNKDINLKNFKVADDFDELKKKDISELVKKKNKNYCY